MLSLYVSYADMKFRRKYIEDSWQQTGFYSSLLWQRDQIVLSEHLGSGSYPDCIILYSSSVLTVIR